MQGCERELLFGLQYFIKHFLLEVWNAEFFNRPLEEIAARYKRRMDTSLGVGAVDIAHIKALHNLGYLPLEIRVLPEGTRVPIRVPMFTIHNTLPESYWLTNYLESVMSCMLWKPCTSATTARFYRKLLEDYAVETGSPLAFVPWQAHDFSFRGMDGLQDSALSGAGHLLSFTGTDTVLAIDLLEDYYGANAEKELVGGSVPATEHSVMCMGSKECEIETFRRLLTEIYPDGIVSVVSDTWDFWRVITEYGTELKPLIMARDGKLVIRPDSGDPVKIICGDAPAPEGSPAHKGAIECLWDVFDGTRTEKGYKMLDSHIGLIYGDSITPDRAWKIMEGLKQKGFASGNVVFGVGSYTYQYVTRDTYGFAVKSTHGEIEGKPYDIFKDPVTDSGIKKSARGRIRVVRQNGEFAMQDSQDGFEGGELVPVSRDGKLLVEQTLAEIRERVAA